MKKWMLLSTSNMTFYCAFLLAFVSHNDNLKHEQKRGDDDDGEEENFDFHNKTFFVSIFHL